MISITATEVEQTPINKLVKYLSIIAYQNGIKLKQGIDWSKAKRILINSVIYN